MTGSAGAFVSRPLGPRVHEVATATPVTCAEAYQRWQSDDGFCAAFGAVLRDAPFGAFRWETPPVTADALDQPFRFVLVDSPGLDRAPDRGAFAAHFDPGAGVVAFAPTRSGSACSPSIER